MKQFHLRPGVVICLWLTGVAVAQAPPVSGLTNFPMLGIIRGQTLQINMVAYPPDPCDVTLGFQNSSGNPIGSSITVNLLAGQSATLGLNGNSIVSSTGERVEVLPTVVVNSQPNGCVASAELFNNSTRITKVLVPGAVGYPPTPALGMLGVTLNQTVRLNAIAYPPNPCAGTLSFNNANGQQVGNTMSVDLNPGQAAFLDLPGSDVVSGTGQRGEVLPVLTTSSTTCVISAEIYNNSTAGTAVFFPPSPCSATSPTCAAF